MCAASRTLAGLLVLAAAALLTAGAAGQSIETSAGPVTAEIVASGLSHPWALAFLPDGGLLVTERPGRLRIVRGGRAGEPIEGVPEVWANGQGGLLDVVLAPDFAQSGRLYLTFAEPG
ncbi:MAG: PQQ-dependent sugar dehydrogenase, partial [Cucumibacter sp.]